MSCRSDGFARAVRVMLAAVLMALLSSASRAEDNGLERAIKATYLYKFAPFVDWPPSAFSSPTAPFVLCIVGDSPFGDLLDRAVSGQSVGRHPIAVRRERTIESNPGCNILYAAGSSEQPVAAILAEVRGMPVLTVTDASSDGGAAGIIEFVVIDNRVRFDIDTVAAAQNHLAISSKLLSLAAHVRSTP